MSPFSYINPYLKLLHKPYELLLWSGIFLLIAELFAFNFSIAKLRQHMSFEFPLVYVHAVPIILILFWLIYKATKSRLYSNKLTWIHIIVTITTSVYLTALPFILRTSGLAGRPRHYYNYGYDIFNSFSIFDDQSPTVIVVFLMAALGYGLYLINLLLGINKPTRNRTTT
jgi:hypothetical protein